MAVLMSDSLARYLAQCKPPKRAALVQRGLFGDDELEKRSQPAKRDNETLVDRYLSRDLEPIENQLSPADLQRWRSLVKRLKR